MLIGDKIEDAIRAKMDSGIGKMKSSIKNINEVIKKNGGIGNTVVKTTSNVVKKIDLKRFAKAKLNNVTAPIKKVGRGVSEGVSLFNKNGILYIYNHNHTGP
jgi:hypothetical protein